MTSVAGTASLTDHGPPNLRLRRDSDDIEGAVVGYLKGFHRRARLRASSPMAYGSGGARLTDSPVDRTLARYSA